MEPKVKRIIYCYDDDKSFKQIEGEELEKFSENFERAHMFAALHGYIFKPVDWQTIKLDYDTAKNEELSEVWHQ